MVNSVGNTVNTVKRYLSGGGNSRQASGASSNWNGGSSGYNPISRGYGGSAIYVSAAQQQAIRTAQRQLRISNEYTKATGNKGKPKTKEGKNFFRNFGDAVLKMLTNFCTSNDKSKDDAKNSRNTEKLAAIGKKQMEAYGIYEKPDGSGFTLDSGTVTENMVNNFVGGSVLSYAGIKSQQGAAGKTSSSSGKSVVGNSAQKTGGAEKNIKGINPSKIRFSQTSVNGSDDIIASMRANGWKGDPIDVVRMPDGNLTTLDNTRVAAARKVGIDIQATVRNYDDLLPKDMVARFTTPKGIPKTWGEATDLRIGKQKADFRNNTPMGSFDLEKMK
ncbi:hypothetical protein RU86_GL001817 [Lactococcus piscium]|uniref:Pre-toxin TG domain-containing protein n=1 Tax=Pseudolactococcus piscium TaxID=1364 RepID=A0A2A5RT87_9LACT|nr:hypothetical protein RU86_GL001817 [Lactococcus piscium]